MGKLIVELYGHPILFVITLLFILGFLGMTYEFILRLFGKQSNLHSVIVDAGKKKDDEKDDIVKVDDPEDEFEEKEEDAAEEDNNPFKVY